MVPPSATTADSLTDSTEDRQHQVGFDGEARQAHRQHQGRRQHAQEARGADRSPQGRLGGQARSNAPSRWLADAPATTPWRGRPSLETLRNPPPRAPAGRRRCRPRHPPSCAQRRHAPAYVPVMPLEPAVEQIQPGTIDPRADQPRVVDRALGHAAQSEAAEARAHRSGELLAGPGARLRSPGLQGRRVGLRGVEPVEPIGRGTS